MENQEENYAVLDNLLYITNWTDQDFDAMWNGNKYPLPKQKMTPVVISTPEDNQEIRKLWALKLCQRELNKDERFHKEAPTDIDLAPLMAKCLEPLEKAPAIRIPEKKSQAELQKIQKIEKTFRPAEESEGVLNSGSPLAI